MRIQPIPCDNWAQFRHVLYPELFGGPCFEEGRFLFRGVGDETWRLESSFDRYAADIPLAEREAAANRLLELFAQECASDEAIPRCPPADNRAERIAVAQHHGLPTRALDWTSSPYVAAFFAFATAPPDATPTSANVAIWALDRRQSVWTGSLGAEILHPAVTPSDRILRQRGYMTHLRAAQSSLEAWIEACESDTVGLRKFTVPRAEARVALADLSAMNISATRLFPDLGGAARGAQARFAAARPH
jgi:hypothetical protein